MTRVEPGLGEIQETLLIPLYGRARDARARRSVLNDRRAVELVDGIDYDFSGFKGPSLSGSVLRSAIFDGWVRQFLREHPAGTVVDIGTGLNTRFDRLDNGSVRWFDVDLPDTIALRRRFFTDRDRCTMVSGSVLETDWFDTVAEAPAPYLFVIEAVLVYFTEDQARTVVTQLAERSPGALLAFDTGGAVMMRNQERNGSMKAVTARMQWVCEEPKRLESWGMQLLDSRTFATPQPEVGRGWPARYRYGLPALARIAGPAVNSYKLNLFRLG